MESGSQFVLDLIVNGYFYFGKRKKIYIYNWIKI